MRTYLDKLHYGTGLIDGGEVTFLKNGIHLCSVGVGTVWRLGENFPA